MSKFIEITDLGLVSQTQAAPTKTDQAKTILTAIRGGCTELLRAFGRNYYLFYYLIEFFLFNNTGIFVKKNTPKIKINNNKDQAREFLDKNGPMTKSLGHRSLVLLYWEKITVKFKHQHFINFLSCEFNSNHPVLLCSYIMMC